MNKNALEFWQATSMRGDVSAEKFSDIVDLVLVDRPDTEIREIAETINADWAETDHDDWLRESDAGEIASWVVSGL